MLKNKFQKLKPLWYCRLITISVCWLQIFWCYHSYTNSTELLFGWSHTCTATILASFLLHFLGQLIHGHRFSHDNRFRKARFVLFELFSLFRNNNFVIISNKRAFLLFVLVLCPRAGLRWVAGVCWAPEFPVVSAGISLQ